jgi:hypothetical protein
MFALVNSLIIVALVIMDVVAEPRSSAGTFVGVFIFIYILATFIPGWAVLVRRLHDTNRTGWWALLAFVPVGGLVLLIFTLIDSDSGENQYGPNPKLPSVGSAVYSPPTPGYENPPQYTMAQAAGVAISPLPVTQPPAAFCPACGKQLNPAAKFCVFCGKAL